MRWLDPVRRALDESPAPVPVFFRDDDAGWGTPRLVRLLEVVEQHGVALDLAVIPAALDAVLARELTARSGVRLHQHGLAHVDHEPAGRRCEFGPARDLAAQAADIAAGRRVLLDAFGDRLDPVFTPPWNRCTSSTGEALVALGITVLSRDVTAPRLDRPGLAEVPVTVDWSGKRHGVPFTRSDVAGRLAAGVRAGGPVGVMLHHAVTADEDLLAVEEFVGLVAAHPAAVPTTITALARRGVTAVRGGTAGRDPVLRSSSTT
jgi:peptidoglycan/xylan/chitin deacetylase (PgdA/CDA1 family)